MTFSVATPLSYVRFTTNEASPINKRRRRPTFSLHLDINLTRSFCATSSQSTTPALSPTQSCVPTPSPLDSLPPSPVTPTDAISQWSNEDHRSSSEHIPAFNFIARMTRDDPCFAIHDFPSSSTGHASADISIQLSGNQGYNVPDENRQLTSTPHSLPQANFSGRNSISSVPQEGTDMEQSLLMCVKNDTSASTTPRSSRPRDEFERVVPDHITPRELASTSQLNDNPCPRFVVLDNYRQLSAREMKGMKLGRGRHYKCLMVGCDRLFSRKSNVENHIRTHLDDKPFICSVSTWWVYNICRGDSPGNFGPDC